ncbi:MAG: hypothetical protein M3Y54_14295 [Bacteroidota bacterium]|nr:hypothetical protein [Bacteroidota bacterium]
MNQPLSTLRSCALALLMGSIAVAQTGCSQADKQEVSAGGDQAYNDLDAFVTNTESGVDSVGDEMKADYDRQSAQMETDFQAKYAAARKNAGRGDDARRQDLESLQNRYITASEKRTVNWDNRTKTGDLGQYYKPSSPAARLTAANARGTYESFVQNVKQHQQQYDINDWRNINAEWRAMDEAYDKVKGDIPAGDLADIQKEKLKYAAFKSWDKTKIRAGQAGDAVSNSASNAKDEVSNTASDAKAETADERSRAGQAISNTASDVKQAGQDVGHGAAEVGKDIGHGAAKAGKKVGNTVKDVFDGKDDEKK